jgi:uncharacterized protein YeaO (DUF488 family)
MLEVKRIYDPSSKQHGCRILVDRLWPRGLTREKAGVDLWLREVAPSDDLRKWFGHDRRKWQEFRRKYRGELRGKRKVLSQIRKLEREKGNVTLLFAAKDEKHNNAVALLEILRKG